MKNVLRNSPFVGEALAGSWRENNLLAPTRRRASPGPRVHDGTIVTERPDEMWAIDGTACMTDQGNATVFVVIDHCTGECLGAHAARRGTRMEAIDTLRQAIRATRGTFDRDVAASVALRHDHGSQFISHAFQDELQFVGIRPSPSFVRSRPTRVKWQRLCRTIHSNTQGAIALAHTIRNRRRTRCCASRLCASIQQSLDPRASWIQNARVGPSLPEFKAEAVRLCQIGDHMISCIASDLNIGENALREWVHHAKADAGNGVPGTLTSDEREKLARLRREHKRMAMDLEILKKAAEFFARRSP